MKDRVQTISIHIRVIFAMCVTSTSANSLPPTHTSPAPTGRPNLSSVFVPGNDTVDEATILRRIEEEAGDPRGHDRPHHRSVAGIPASPPTIPVRVLFENGRRLDAAWTPARRWVRFHDEAGMEQRIPVSRIQSIRIESRSPALSRREEDVTREYAFPDWCLFRDRSGREQRGRPPAAEWTVLDLMTDRGRQILPLYDVRVTHAPGSNKRTVPDAPSEKDRERILEIQSLRGFSLPDDTGADSAPMGMTLQEGNLPSHKSFPTRLSPPDPSSVAPDITSWMAQMEEGGHVFQIDRYELSEPIPGDFLPVPGQQPRTNLSFSEARAICESQQRRLCTTQEWTSACLGLARRRNDGAIGFAPSEPCNLTTGQPSLTGERARCRTGEGIFDMIGNVREWTIDREYGPVATGGSYQSGAGADCFDHMYLSPDARSPEIGVRCCR